MEGLFSFLPFSLLHANATVNSVVFTSISTQTAISTLKAAFHQSLRLALARVLLARVKSVLSSHPLPCSHPFLHVAFLIHLHQSVAI